jgi:hypothetical protein
MSAPPFFDFSVRFARPYFNECSMLMYRMKKKKKKKTREKRKCRQQHSDHFNINKSGRFPLLSFLLWVHIVNFLKYAYPGSDILPEELDTPSTYARTLS